MRSVEFLEDFVQLVCQNARPAVGNAQTAGLPLHAGAYFDLSRRGGMDDGVVNDIENRLLEKPEI